MEAKEKFTTFEQFRGPQINEQDNIKELEDEPEEIAVPSIVEPIAALPSKVAMPKTLSEPVATILNERLGDEYTAYFFYRNAANWCKNANYKKAAAFFEAEAAGELEHGKGIQDYLTQWNLIPVIPAVTTSYVFANLIDIINKAYEIEFNLLEKYSGNQIELAQTHPATFNFIQKYVDIQNGEVEEYSDYLNALQLINIENKLDVLYFENKYFKL
jgi:ferritin